MKKSNEYHYLHLVFIGFLIIGLSLACTLSGGDSDISENSESKISTSVAKTMAAQGPDIPPSSTAIPPATPTFTPTYTPTATSTPTSIPSQSILYDEDFTNGDVIWWNIQSGDWSVHQDENGYSYWRVTSLGEEPQAWYQAASWENYAFETRIRFMGEEENQISIRTRVNGSKSYSAVVNSQGWCHLAIYDQEYTVLESGNCNPKKNQWFLVKVELRGNQIQLSINNKLWITALNDGIDIGSIGLYLESGSSVEIGHMKVWLLE